MVRIGIVGIGQIGNAHIKHLLERQDVKVVGIFNTLEASSNINTHQHLAHFANIEELLANVDAIIFTATECSQYAWIENAIKSGKHVLIDYPIIFSLAQMEGLVKISKESNVKCLMGNVERFNACFIQIPELIKQPLFIEAHRLMAFSNQRNHLDIIIDLMLYDIDIIIALVKSEIKRITATGVKVMNDSIDIANARLEFSNGCIANLTTSRIAQKPMSKMRIFQKDCYYNLNFLEQQQDKIMLNKSNDDVKLEVLSEKLNIKNPLVALHNSFINSIVHLQPTMVSLEDGYKALDVAEKILKRINFLGDDSNIFTP